MKALMDREDIRLLDGEFPIEGKAVVCEVALEDGVLKIALPEERVSAGCKRGPADTPAVDRLVAHFKHPVVCDVDVMADALEVEDR